MSEFNQVQQAQLLDILARQILSMQDQMQAIMGTLALLKGIKPGESPAARDGGKAPPYVFGEIDPLPVAPGGPPVQALVQRVKEAASQHAQGASTPEARRARGRGRRVSTP